MVSTSPGQNGEVPDEISGALDAGARPGFHQWGRPNSWIA